MTKLNKLLALVVGGVLFAPAAFAQEVGTNFSTVDGQATVRLLAVPTAPTLTSAEDIEFGSIIIPGDGENAATKTVAASAEENGKITLAAGLGDVTLTLTAGNCSDTNVTLGTMTGSVDIDGSTTDLVQGNPSAAISRVSGATDLTVNTGGTLTVTDAATRGAVTCAYTLTATSSNA